MPVSADARLGEGARILHPDLVNLYGCSIGSATRIGTLVEIQRGVEIGEWCKMSSNTFICEGVTIEDKVFVGHGVMFIKDRFPRATTDERGQISDILYKSNFQHAAIIESNRGGLIRGNLVNMHLPAGIPANGRGQGRFGIFLLNTQGQRIQDNVIYDPSPPPVATRTYPYGVLLDGIRNLEISGNTFTGLGTADPDPSNFTAPYRATYIQVHSPNLVNGRVDVISHDQGNFTDLRPRHSGDRVEVDPQLIRMVEVAVTNGVRIQIDATEVHHPEQLRGVADDYLLGGLFVNVLA